MSISLDKPMLRQFFRFALVGAAGFLVNAILVECLAAFMGPVLAQILAFPAAATSTWLMNRRFTFGAQVKPSFIEWRNYLIANSVGMVANNLFYFLTIFVFTIAYDHPVIAVAVGSVAGLFFNFAATRAYVFKPESTKKDL